MNYICYKILLRCKCCEKQIEVASFDYYHNAIARKNQLIETFGKGRIEIIKKIRPLIKTKQGQKFYEIE
jgi:hypothetical protein